MELKNKNRGFWSVPVKNNAKFVFENIGGSFQYRIRRAEDLHKILELDSTAWAALCVPVSSLNGDPAFFKAMDEDHNGMIRVDEVKTAISWLMDVLEDIKVLNDKSDTLPISALNMSNAEAAQLAEFAQAHAEELQNDNLWLDLTKIRAKFAAVTAGPLCGNGVLSGQAAATVGASALYNDITALYKTPDALTSAQLEKFVTDAADFIEWSKTAERPLFRNNDPTPYYNCFKALESKLDEYFRFCDLLCIDPAHAARFALDPAKLPELDLLDSAKIDEILRNAPLAKPSAGQVLVLKDITNPHYEAAIKQFMELFALETLSRDEYIALKAEFADYINYLARAHGDLAGQLGREKLEQHLADTQIAALRKLFTEDQSIGGVVTSLQKLERLLLYCRYILEFVNNFVSFEAFFNPGKISMLQAGRLIMDGKSYNLAVWIDDIATHKKIAVRSNLCLIYLDVISSGPKPIQRKAAVAVTGGSLSRIYVGKPAFFVDNDNITYNGKIIDMVEGPISFWQTLIAPFRRISSAISEKLQKLTDFSSTEKELTKAIDQGKLPSAPAAAAPPAVPLGQKLFGNGSVMLLAGGLSVAALGAGLSFILKSITQAITSISALPFYVILIWIGVLIAVFLVPTAIFAFLKLRKRNLTLFLEAGGWAVNLPMRLNMHVSGIFTHGTAYPPQTVFKVIKVSSSNRKRIWLFVLLTLIVLLAAAAAFWFLKCSSSAVCTK